MEQRAQIFNKEYTRFILQSKPSMKCPALNSSESELNFWKLLRTFENIVRVEIVKLLLQFEMMSLSDVARKLEGELGRKITLPGLLKHVKILEDAGIVAKESGAFLPTPDARKTVYLLEGKERVEKILKQLEGNVGNLLLAGALFSETTELVRKTQRTRHKLAEEERKRLEFLLDQCESERVYNNLTEDEKKKVKLWRMTITFLEG
jgi:DNA-binding transcriptional ArsR family regulator